MSSLIEILAFKFSLVVDQLTFQSVGMLVVFGCLSVLAIILSCSGAIAASFARRAKEKAAAKAAVNTSPAPAARSAAPVSSASPAEIPAEVIAAISAAVHAEVGGMNHRIIDIRQSAASGYATSGRTEIFASHRIRPVSRG